MLFEPFQPALCEREARHIHEIVGACLITDCRPPLWQLNLTGKHDLFGPGSRALRIAGAWVNGAGAPPPGDPQRPRRRRRRTMSSAPDGIVALRFLSVVPNITAEHMDRQRELLTATARTEQHPGIRGMHLLVVDALQARGMLAAHGYTLGRHVTISELGRWPLNSDLVEYASTVLRGQWVLASNDDVYPEGDAWLRPPDGALMLSRHAKERETCDGCLRSCNAMRRTPHTSLCNRANVGSFDAWVHRFSSPVTNATDPVATAMLATPRHSFGADNLLGHVFEEHLGVPLRNRCHHYKLFHLHCRLTTSDAKNGRQSGKRRGYGEGFRTGVHNHGDMARLIMRHDPQKHSWNEARTIVRKQWPPE